MNKQRKFPTSPAYIDSSLVSSFIIGLALFSTWIASATASVINPWWLGGSIFAIGIYQMLIFWLMHQYSSVDRILFIFTTNMTSLGLILSLVGWAISAQLPVDLPILNLVLYLSGVQATSFSPGSVALSYGLLGVIAGFIFVYVASLVENTRILIAIKKLLRLDAADRAIDETLDDISYQVENTWHYWVLVPLLLLVAVNIVVVGSAALL